MKMPWLRQLEEKLVPNLFVAENAAGEHIKDLKSVRDRSYSAISLLVAVCGAPILAYGAYIFFRQGDILPAALELLSYVVIIGVITSKTIDTELRKFLLILVFYLLSILL
ncbi:MAG: hypothetical protein HGA22_14090, partial [Clostridiales bacterium]|nr:hypothetical protein [Clostridiales bacterium]